VSTWKSVVAVGIVVVAAVVVVVVVDPAVEGKAGTVVVECGIAGE